MLKKVSKYSNRRLYSHDVRSYITLSIVGSWWDQGHEISVVDYNTGINLTVQTLLEIIQQRVARKELEIKPEMIRRLCAEPVRDR